MLVVVGVLVEVAVKVGVGVMGAVLVAVGVRVGTWKFKWIIFSAEVSWMLLIVTRNVTVPEGTPSGKAPYRSQV